jgi:hypothetical protein
MAPYAGQRHRAHEGRSACSSQSVSNYIGCPPPGDGSSSGVTPRPGRRDLRKRPGDSGWWTPIRVQCSKPVRFQNLCRRSSVDHALEERRGCLCEGLWRVHDRAGVPSCRVVGGTSGTLQLTTCVTAMRLASFSSRSSSGARSRLTNALASPSTMPFGTPCFSIADGSRIPAPDEF